MQTILIISSVALWVVLGLGIWALITLIGMVREINQRLDTIQPQGGLEPGQTAPSFTASRLDGTTVSLDSFAGRRTAFVFSMPSCKHCQTAVPVLNKLRLAAQRADVELVSVIAGEEAAVRAFVEQYQVQLPVLMTTLGPGSFTELYKIAVFPAYCVIDRQGTVQAGGVLGDAAWERMSRQWEQTQPITSEIVAST